MAARKKEPVSRVSLELHLVRFHAEGNEKEFDKTLEKWYKFLNIEVLRASNEQTPWTSAMIGFPVSPMPLKSDCGFAQVGDYQFIVHCPGRDPLNCFGSLVVERKGKEDAYNTLFGFRKTGKVNPKTGKEIKESNRDRFYKEIDRYYADPRFNQFVIIVESDISAWLRYNPPSGYGATLEQRLAVLASLQARGVHVHFAGSRSLAAKYYGHCIRQNVLKNWRKWIVETPELGFA